MFYKDCIKILCNPVLSGSRRILLRAAIVTGRGGREIKEGTEALFPWKEGGWSYCFKFQDIFVGMADGGALFVGYERGGHTFLWAARRGLEFFRQRGTKFHNPPVIKDHSIMSESLYCSYKRPGQLNSMQFYTLAHICLQIFMSIAYLFMAFPKEIIPS